MYGFDWIPVWSQLKSFCQLITGDREGAARTQLNFFKECLFVSQITSIVQLIIGDCDGACETYKRCAGRISKIISGIPTIGIMKGKLNESVDTK